MVYAIRKKQNILTDILFELDIKNIDEINYKGKKYDGKTYLVLRCNIEAAGW